VKIADAASVLLRLTRARETYVVINDSGLELLHLDDARMKPR
jgi:hypothetical protein